jgi:altronate dehydratase
MVESVASDNVSSTTAVGFGIDVEVGFTTGVGVITTLIFADILRKSL